jgi:5-(carboxyamino)imidazole ribonucleotide synthase
MPEVLAPGATIGILGGGQLARMMALAAAPLGLKCHIYAPAGDNPAFDVAARRTIAGYEDAAALAQFAAAVSVVTYEFENVPEESVRAIEGERAVRPDAFLLGVTQDRVIEHARRGVGLVGQPVDAGRTQLVCAGVDRLDEPAADALVAGVRRDEQVLEVAVGRSRPG